MPATPIIGAWGFEGRRYIGEIRDRPMRRRHPSVGGNVTCVTKGI